MRGPQRFAAATVAIFVMGALLVASGAGAEARSSGRRASSLRVTFRGRTQTLRAIARAARPSVPPTRPSLGLRGLSPQQEFPTSGFPGGSDSEGADKAGSSIPVPRAGSVPIKYWGSHLRGFWSGSSHFDSRYADYGNQFSGEPPDQGLCTGRGYVMETVNSVVQIYNTTGQPLLGGNPLYPGGGPVGLSLNQFYGYPSEFVRPAGPFGQFEFDPSCFFDAASGRWFHLADRLEQDPVTGDFTGPGGFDLAVSTSSNPLGSWFLYSVDTTDNGQNGTPDHECPSGFCFGDYPQIGVDANGVYVTTNEFDFVDFSVFDGAQLYAFRKASLTMGSPTALAAVFENLQLTSLGVPAGNVQPAVSQPGSYVDANGGTEYFATSTNTTTSAADTMAVFALTGTSSLDHGILSLELHEAVVDTIPYHDPPLALQRPGPTPLLRCINLGVNCVGDPAPFQQPGPRPLDAGGGAAVRSAFLQDGVVWAVLNTAIKGSGGSKPLTAATDFAPRPIGQKSGVAYFAFQPDWSSGDLGVKVLQQGYLTVDGNNLSYPAIAMGNGQSGFISLSLVGPDHYPSAAYASIALGHAPSRVVVMAGGAGPSDGFTGTFEGGSRPRWGDYGSAVAAPNGTVWIAGEWIANRCSFQSFLADTTCGFTRSLFANWNTFVAKLK